MLRSRASRFVASAMLVGAGIWGCASDATSSTPEPSTSGSTGSSSSTDDGTSTTPPFEAHFSDAGTTADSGTTTQSCKDPGDPGATDTTATALPDTDDCNNDILETTGLLSNGTDIDMYKLSAKDKTFCSLDTTFSTPSEKVRLCVFARCRNATQDPVTGCQGGQMSTNDLGWKGCCNDGPGEATPEWDCSGYTDDDGADFFLQVKPTTASTCVPYTIKYRF